MADPERLLTQQQLADYLGVSVPTIQRWRRQGTGPPFLLLGTRPRYRRAQVDAWLDEQATGRKPRRRRRS
jgi:excisionase family DNA binding protein